jgi:hypothetical protein
MQAERINVVVDRRSVLRSRETRLPTRFWTRLPMHRGLSATTARAITPSRGEHLARLTLNNLVIFIGHNNE